MGINLFADLGYDDNDPEVRKAREAAAVYAQLLDSLVASRKRAGLSQKALAKRMRTTQSAVSEIESGQDARMSTVLKYAQAAGCEIHIEVTPSSTATQSRNPEWVTINVVPEGAPALNAAWVDTDDAPEVATLTARQPAVGVLR